MAPNNCQWLIERLMSKKQGGTVNITTLTTLQTQTNAILLGLSKKLDVRTVGVNMVQSPYLICDICSESHGSDACMYNLELVNFVEKYNWHRNPYSNTYNLGWKNSPNFSWSNNNQGNVLSNIPNFSPLSFEQPN